MNRFQLDSAHFAMLESRYVRRGGAVYGLMWSAKKIEGRGTALELKSELRGVVLGGRWPQQASQKMGLRIALAPKRLRNAQPPSWGYGGGLRGRKPLRKTREIASLSPPIHCRATRHGGGSRAQPPSKIGEGFLFEKRSRNVRLFLFLFPLYQNKIP